MPEENADVKDKSPDPSSGDKGGQSGKGAGQDSDKSEGKDSQGKDTPSHIPYERFQEVNKKAKDHEKVADWYRENVGDPEQVLELIKLKEKLDAEEARKAKEKDSKFPKEKREYVRNAVFESVPELQDVLDGKSQQSDEDFEGQLDDAADQVRDLCQKEGFPKDEAVVSRIAVHIMDEIKTDPRLMRRWNRGDLNCIDLAFDRYMDKFVNVIRKVEGKSKSDDKELARLRKIKGLPTLPGGGTAAGLKVPEKPKEEQGKGITKSTHHRAWAHFNAHLNE